MSINFCILVTSPQGTAIVGPFATAQEAAKFVEEKFVVPQNSYATILPMMNQELWKDEQRPPSVPKMEIEVNGRHAHVPAIADWQVGVHGSSQGIHVRVDDKNSLDFWLELLIKDCALIKLK